MKNATPTVATPVRSGGMWDRLTKVRGALCSDGRRRTATITGEPDTYFSTPARVTVGGRIV